MDEYNYHEELKIDLFALHHEAQEQPAKLFKYAKAYAEAKRELAEAERALKVIRSNVARLVREIEGKITVDALKEQVELNPDVGSAEYSVIDFSYKVNLLWGAVEAFKGRKSAISTIVELYQLGYWSVSTTKAERELIEEEVKKAHEQELQSAEAAMAKFKPGLAKG